MLSARHTTFFFLPSGVHLFTTLICALFTGGLAVSLEAQASARQPEFDGGWRAPPPPGSLQTMRKSVRLGKDKGYTAKLKGVETTDKNFQPFLIQVTVSGERPFELYRVEFVTDSGEFSTELPKKSNARWDVGIVQAGNGGQGSGFSAHETEQRTFNINLQQAKWLSETITLKVTLVGGRRNVDYTIKGKQLRLLTKWLTPRIKKLND